MWRGVNRSDKKATALMTRDSKSSGQHAGSLNQFGSGAFCDFFIKQWIHEGFPNYTEVTKPALSSGSAVLKRIVESSFKHAEGKEGEEDAISGGGGRGDNEEKAEDTGSGDNISRDAEKHPRKRKILHGFMLAALFRTRPELAEMIHMEINNMHWSSAALD